MTVAIILTLVAILLGGSTAYLWRELQHERAMRQLERLSFKVIRANTRDRIADCVQLVEPYKKILRRDSEKVYFDDVIHELNAKLVGAQMEIVKPWG